MRLPESVTTPRLRLRRWTVDEAAVLSRAVEESLDHLRPWMSWTVDEPLSSAARIELLQTFQRNWESGGDVVYGAFAVGIDDPAGGTVLDGTVVGGCGFNRRAEPSVLELGYWVHVDHLRQGYATEIATALTDAGFDVAGVEQVEIHHDRANTRSGAVPARLGFTFEGERPDDVMAPAEEGIDCRWIMRRSDWISRRARRR